jgi:hypothetical protein
MMPNVIVINAMATDMILHVLQDTLELSVGDMLKDIAKDGASNQVVKAPTNKQLVVLTVVQEVDID